VKQILFDHLVGSQAMVYIVFNEKPAKCDKNSSLLHIPNRYIHKQQAGIIERGPTRAYT